MAIALSWDNLYLAVPPVQKFLLVPALKNLLTDNTSHYPGAKQGHIQL